MAKAIPLSLGVQATDIVSGLKGIVSARTEQINGNIQYAIQPKGKGDTLPDGHFIDAPQIQVTGKGISDKVMIPVATDIRLGQKIKILTSGEVGIAYEKITYVNGCVYFMIRLPVKDNSSKGENVFSSCAVLQIVDDGIIKDITSKENKPTGGPSRSMRDYSMR
jgi:hypothetical protein